MSGEALFFGSGMAIGGGLGLAYVQRVRQHDVRRALVIVVFGTVCGLAMNLAYFAAVIYAVNRLYALLRWATTVPPKPKAYSIDEFCESLRSLPTPDEANVVPSLRARRR